MGLIILDERFTGNIMYAEDGTIELKGCDGNNVLLGVSDEFEEVEIVLNRENSVALIKKLMDEQKISINDLK